MKHKHPNLAARSALFTLATTAAVPVAMGAEPAVQGPESVSDWFDAGQEYIANAKTLFPIRHRANNVILFVGDGMGVSTVTSPVTRIGATRSSVKLPKCRT
ncbi:MAG: hypothetical protein ACT4QB_17700 [Gammaproteobacteria bacterium]